MDEVLEKLESTNISHEFDENKTNFDGLYKNWGKLGNQEERRKELLEVQKSNRNSKLDKFRGIIDLVNAVEDNETFRHRSYYRPSIYVAGFTKTSPTYKNVLMMSEWMIEKPEDFHENWLVMPCPKGVRMLVVANQGRTKCYTKYGQFRTECRTALPGGNPCEIRNINKNRCCVLDCFFDEKTNTMHVIDMLAWNSQPMTDGEAEFRYYWLQTNLGDIPDLKTVNKRNKLIFNIIPKTPCDKESLNKFMMTCPHFPKFTPTLDGFLFYHKRAHYVAGQTPLVGWLFPYMVPEILGMDVTVSSKYTDLKPTDYVNQAAFIQKFEEKLAKKKAATLYRKFTPGKHSPRGDRMDTTTANPDNKDEDNNKKKCAKGKIRTSSTQCEDMDEDENAHKDVTNKEEMNGCQHENINEAQETGDITDDRVDVSEDKKDDRIVKEEEEMQS